MLSVEPRFTDEPDDAEVCAGRNVTLSALSSGDPATLTYEWRRQWSGSATSEVIGGNATSVTVAATATMQVWCTAKSGNSPWIASACAATTTHYWVRVTSPLGCSSTAAVTVP